MMGNGKTEERELQEFLALPREQQQLRIYQAARAARGGTSELYFTMGSILREVSGLRVDLQKYAAAIEVALTARAAKAPSIPPPRAPMPSMLNVHEEDITEVKELKAKLTPLIAERDAELAVQAADARRLRTLATMLGLLIAGAAVAGIIWAVFRFAIAHAATAH